MATVRDIHDIREIFIEAAGSAYINAGHVFDEILGAYVDRMNSEYQYTQDDLDSAIQDAYDEGYYDGKRAVENAVQ